MSNAPRREDRSVTTLANVLTRSRSTHNRDGLVYEDPSLLHVATEDSPALSIVGDMVRRVGPWVLAFAVGWIIGRIW